MKSVGKSLIAFMFLCLFVTHHAFAVSLSACDPITNSCCCKSENTLSTPCSEVVDSEESSCCAPQERTHRNNSQESCFCGAEAAIPEYVQPVAITLPQVTYLPEVKAYMDVILASIGRYSLMPQELSTTRDRPIKALSHFALCSWPTICLRC